MTMVDTPRSEPSPLSLALGRVPSGLFILTVRRRGPGDGHACQLGAAGRLRAADVDGGREPRPVRARVGRRRGLVRPEPATGRPQAAAPAFRRGALLPDANPFDGLALYADLGSAPVLDEALSYLDCEVVGSVASGDHTIFLARILKGANARLGRRADGACPEDGLALLSRLDRAWCLAPTDQSK